MGCEYRGLFFNQKIKHQRIQQSAAVQYFINLLSPFPTPTPQELIYQQIQAATTHPYEPTSMADRIAAALYSSPVPSYAAPTESQMARARTQPLPGSGMSSAAASSPGNALSMRISAAAALKSAAAHGGMAPLCAKSVGLMMQAAAGEDDGEFPPLRSFAKPVVQMSAAELDERLNALYERTRDWKRRCEERYNLARREREGESLQGCTFSPRINPTSRYMFAVSARAND